MFFITPSVTEVGYALWVSDGTAAGTTPGAMPEQAAQHNVAYWLNADYLAFDADNIARTTQRQAYHFTTPAYWVASADTFPETWLAGWQRLLAELQPAG